MRPHKQRPAYDPHWCDVVMKFLPRMYRLGQLTGWNHDLFVYAITYFSVEEEMRRGATLLEIRGQRTRILHEIDRAHRPEHDKELFRHRLPAVDDAPEGQPPCVLQPKVGLWRARNGKMACHWIFWI